MGVSRDTEVLEQTSPTQDGQEDLPRGTETAPGKEMKPYGFQEPYHVRRSGDCWPDKQFGERRIGNYRSKGKVHRYFKKNARRVSRKMIQDQLSEGEWQHTA